MESIQVLIERAKAHVMTRAERRTQAISFAFGNATLSNPQITLEMVVEAYDKSEHERNM